MLPMAAASGCCSVLLPHAATTSWIDMLSRLQACCFHLLAAATGCTAATRCCIMLLQHAAVGASSCCNVLLLMLEHAAAPCHAAICLLNQHTAESCCCDLMINWIKNKKQRIKCDFNIKWGLGVRRLREAGRLLLSKCRAHLSLLRSVCVHPAADTAFRSPCPMRQAAPASSSWAPCLVLIRRRDFSAGQY